MAAVVEITEEMDAATRAQRAIAAYEQSRSGPVALVLRGVTPRDMDRILDPIVAALGREVAGVVYVEAAPAQARL